MIRLRSERLKRGWSMVELARRAKISESTLSRLENRKLFPYPGWKKRLSIVLHVKQEELFLEVIDNDTTPDSH